MKDDYRNPVAHPRVVLEEADARMLFANGESLIIAMAQDLQRLLSLDHNSSQEHLLRSPANAARLKEAVRSLDKGGGTERKLAE